MKGAFYLVIVLTIAMLFIPGALTSSGVKYLGLDITTWIGGIGIIMLSSFAIFMAKGNIKPKKKIPTKRKSTTKKKK